MRLLRRTALAFILVWACVGESSADDQHPSIAGQWDITFYGESGIYTGNLKERVCFQSDGFWYLTTASGWPDYGWQGSWYKKGDRFRWYGLTEDLLSTADFGQIISGREMVGEFSHFFTTSASRGYNGNWKAEKVRDKCEFVIYP